MEKNNDIKQIIVIRKDLNMRKGKIAAQACHASLGSFLQFFKKTHNDNAVQYSVNIQKDTILDKWLHGIYTKICLYVNSEDELVDLYNRIKINTDIPCYMVEDVGLTEFHNVKTKTCIAIGPYWGKEIDKYTGNLKLL